MVATREMFVCVRDTFPHCMHKRETLLGKELDEEQVRLNSALKKRLAKVYMAAKGREYERKGGRKEGRKKSWRIDTC